jgi:pimeloyl-ACP methyl ester carboxylesterase
MPETHLLRLFAPGNCAPPLGILERQARTANAYLPPVLLLHGATFGAALLDLRREGYSLMAALAEPGRAVYALDIRGYGNSHGCEEMEQPPGRSPPFSGADEAMADIAAAVDFILERQAAAALDLVGFSWGTITAARYAGEHPEKIARLVLYAPLYSEKNAVWLDRIADPQDRTRLAPTFGAYRLVTLDDVIRRWDSDLPGGNSVLYRENGLAEQVFEALAELDPLSSSRAPRAFRCPNGALADLVQVFNGRPIYAPARLTMPVLLLRGADDTTSTHSDALRLLSQIASRDKDYRVIAPGSHFLCLEKNRSRLYEEFDRFLGSWPVGSWPGRPRAG